MPATRPVGFNLNSIGLRLQQILPSRSALSIKALTPGVKRKLEFAEGGLKNTLTQYSTSIKIKTPRIKFERPRLLVPFTQRRN
jgi:hypothetical protein